MLGKQSIDYQVKFIREDPMRLVFKNGDSADDDIIHLIAQGDDLETWPSKVEETLFTDSIRDYAIGLRMQDWNEDDFTGRYCLTVNGLNFDELP